MSKRTVCIPKTASAPFRGWTEPQVEAAPLQPCGRERWWRRSDGGDLAKPGGILPTEEWKSDFCTPEATSAFFLF